METAERIDLFFLSQGLNLSYLKILPLAGSHKLIRVSLFVLSAGGLGFSGARIRH